jgi:hypothetical protein
MQAVNFWLHFCVFPKVWGLHQYAACSRRRHIRCVSAELQEMQQFPQRLAGTAWDLAEPSSVCANGLAGKPCWSNLAPVCVPCTMQVGFSGTLDNHRLLPLMVKQNVLEEPRLQGTDGKMLATLLKAPCTTLPAPTVRGARCMLSFLSLTLADSCSAGKQAAVAACAGPRCTTRL